MRKLLHFAICLSALSALLLSGCGATQEESELPWSRPAHWENQVPGMPPVPGAPR